MGRYLVKSWSRFQHYGTRRPPWIKLYRSVLDDPDYLTMRLASMALAPLFWLLASESEDGSFTDNPAHLAFRTHRSITEVESALKELSEKGFIEHVGVNASNTLATRYQHARPERETETEREGEGMRAREASKARPEDASEIQAWLDEMGEQRFSGAEVWDHYEAQGWVRGNGRKIRDWRSTVRVTWIAPRDKRGEPQPKSPATLTDNELLVRDEIAHGSQPGWKRYESAVLAGERKPGTFETFVVEAAS